MYIISRAPQKWYNINEMITMRRKIFIVLALAGQVITYAQKAETIESITANSHEPEWYAAQAGIWQKEVDANPRSQWAWRNLFRATLYQEQFTGGWGENPDDEVSDEWAENPDDKVSDEWAENSEDKVSDEWAENPDDKVSDEWAENPDEAVTGEEADWSSAPDDSAGYGDWSEGADYGDWGGGYESYDEDFAA